MTPSHHDTYRVELSDISFPKSRNATTTAVDLDLGAYMFAFLVTCRASVVLVNLVHREQMEQI